MIEGELVALSPLQVSGMAVGLADMTLAINGRGNYYVPGESLTGPMRHWLQRRLQAGEEMLDKLLGPELGDNTRGKDTGHASFLEIEDAEVALPAGLDAEIRDGVAIERFHGVPGDHLLYNREVLPRGSRLSLVMTLNIPEAEKNDNSRGPAFLFLTGKLLEGLERGSIRFGAFKTRGSGRLKLDSLEITEETLNTSEGIIEVLNHRSDFLGGNAGGHTAVGEAESGGAGSDAVNSFADEIGKLGIQVGQKEPMTFSEPATVTMEIDWRPESSVMIKTETAGIAIEMLPLVGGTGDNTVAPVVPGSSVKGSIRSRMEMLVRTVLKRPTSNNDDFEKQIELPLVSEVFGVRRGSSYKWAGAGALTVDDCYAVFGDGGESGGEGAAVDSSGLDSSDWLDLVSAADDEDVLAALRKMGLDSWQLAYGTAIDRWLGNAADKALFTMLEARRQAWSPLRLTLELDRLNKDEVPHEVAVALMLMVARDLEDKLITIGFGGNQEMGLVCVDKVRMLFENVQIEGTGQESAENGDGASTGIEFESFEGFCVDNKALLKKLNEAWKSWIGNTSQNEKEDSTTGEESNPQ